MFPVEKIARIVKGDLLCGESATPTRAIHDSRLVEPGDLFVALPGSRANGHRFLANAFERGASAAIVSDTTNLPSNARNLIHVANSTLALHQWAAAWRDTLDATIIAITGTNGKTTVRALLGHMLSAHGIAYVSPHNYNTEIGLPISLLAMPSDATFGVFELGAEQPGDIATLARILRPHLGIITSVGPGHLDGFKTIEAVAVEKWSLAKQLPDDGAVIINADAQPLLERSETASTPVITTGLNCGDIRGRVLQAVPSLSIALENNDATLDSPLVGTHNAGNLLLAAVAANKLGMDWGAITDQAQSFEPIPHRLNPLQASFGTILDDTYNANPASARAALEVLSSYNGREFLRVFVFGEMLGLGTKSDRFHCEIAQLALNLSIDAILPIGQAATSACRRVTSASVASKLPKDDTIVIIPRPEIADWIRRKPLSLVVLVKGSRDLKLELLVNELLLP